LTAGNSHPIRRHDVKVICTMHEPDEKKHSVKFNLEKVESVTDQNGSEYAAPPFDVDKWKQSIYVGEPVARKCKRIRVTIEEL
jgi:hypothetical protein